MGNVPGREIHHGTQDEGQGETKLVLHHRRFVLHDGTKELFFLVACVRVSLRLFIL